MSTYRGKSAAQINKSMKILFPETQGCKFADYPMTGGPWRKPNEKAPGGGYCFIKTETQMPVDQGFKTGYVWGTGPFGFGYYHLLTKAAHVTLYQRIVNRRVFTGADTGVVCGCFGSAPDMNAIPTELPKIPADDLDDLRLLFHARTLATAANDKNAQQAQMAESKTTAQAHYGYDQNIQLGYNVANVAALAG